MVKCIQVNEGEWEVFPQVTALCIGNAKYFGGGMKITPNANLYNGNFEVNIPTLLSHTMIEAVEDFIHHYLNFNFYFNYIFQVVILQDFKWYDFILKLQKLYAGTHLSEKNVTSKRYFMFILTLT